MLKKILKTNGAQQLSKNELQTISGGGAAWANYCPTGDPDCLEGCQTDDDCTQGICSHPGGYCQPGVDR